MKQIQGWTLVAVWVTATLGMWFLHSVWPDVNGSLREQQHLVGWAQAAGSILAILGAYHLGKLQAVAARALVREQQLVDAARTFETIREVLQHAKFLLRTFREAWETNANLLHDHGEWERVKEVIGSIDLFRCPWPALVSYLVQMPKYLSDAIQTRNHVHSMIDHLSNMGHVEIYDPKRFALEMNRIKDVEGLLELAIEESLSAEKNVQDVRQRGPSG